MMPAFLSRLNPARSRTLKNSVYFTVLGLVGVAPGGETPRVADWFGASATSARPRLNRTTGRRYPYKRYKLEMYVAG